MFHRAVFSDTLSITHKHTRLTPMYICLPTFRQSSVALTHEQTPPIFRCTRSCPCFNHSRIDLHKPHTPGLRTYSQRAKTQIIFYLTASETMYRVLTTQSRPTPITEETHKKTLCHTASETKYWVLATQGRPTPDNRTNTRALFSLTASQPT